MRRRDKEMDDRAWIDGVIRDCQVCRMALARGDEPYLVPVSFGYDGAAIYLHTATAGGLKIDFFTANPAVCFEFERGVELRTHPDTPCRWTLAYESVIGRGRLSESTEPGDKARALDEIMRHYSGRSWPFDPAELARVRTWKIDIVSLTGKKSPAHGKPVPPTA
jgi:hypothetical protein